jgi:cytochrome P450
MFTITNEKKHTAYRRIVGGVYSLSSILKNEQLMDQNVDMFVRRLGEFADRAEEVDFGLWLEMYAYDNIGSVFFGNPFGFLEHSTDHGNYIAAVHKAMPLLSVMTHAPSYFRPVLMVFAAFVPALLRAVISIDGIRKTAVRETDVAMARGTDSRQNHMLSQLLRIVEEKGEKTGITHHEVTGEMWVAVMAGADSTGTFRRFQQSISQNSHKS